MGRGSGHVLSISEQQLPRRAIFVGSNPTLITALIFLIFISTFYFFYSLCSILSFIVDTVGL